ncbi:poxvirus late transcription factor [Faustovirus]|nr:poxvirus late transcription factor [Faustovirus]
MNSKQTKNNVKSTNPDDKCDKCSEWREQGYMQCPKCLKRLRYDPAEFITETILALPSHKRDYDAATKLDYIDFNYAGHFGQLNQKVKEKFPNERYFIRVVGKPTTGTIRLPLIDNKIMIKMTQTDLLESTYPALGCLEGLIKPETASVWFIVESEIKNDLIYDLCLYTPSYTLTNIKSLFELKYSGAVDTIVALSDMKQQNRDRLKKLLV